MDSDMESETGNPPDWRTSLTPDQLASLSAREAKRQDVINELTTGTSHNHLQSQSTLKDLKYSG